MSPFVDIPRILMFKPLPGEPEPEVMLTPETCPCSACSTRVGFSFSIVPEPTTVTAPVTSFLVYFRIQLQQSHQVYKAN